MALPGKPPDGGFDPDQAVFIERIFHKVLYYSGPLEPIANFIFLIPVFFVLVAIPRRRSPFFVLWVCFFISAVAESLHVFIPGRVSSPRDFALNS